MKNLLPFFILFAVLGCNQATKVKTGAGSIENKPAAKPEAGIRRVTIDQSKTFGNMDLTIGEIAIEPGKITVGMTIKNTGKDPIAFYPNQHSIVIGKKQLDATMFNNGGELSGELNGGIERSGSIVFENKQDPLAPAEIKQIGLRLGNVMNTKVFKSVDVDWDLTLPEK